MNVRSLLPIGVAAFLGTAAVVACSASGSVGVVVPGVTLVAYAAPADWGSCDGDEYITIDDPTSCSGCSSAAYAYCDGTSYSQCSCDLTTASGWTDEGIGSAEGGITEAGASVEASTTEEAAAEAATEAAAEAATEAGEEAATTEAGEEAGTTEAGTADAEAEGG
jgi:hypothetical protein